MIASRVNELVRHLRNKETLLVRYYDASRR
jgi:hypothetical protein